MILYFSGTGNSRYIANRISERTNQALLCLNDRIKAEDFSNITTGEKHWHSDTWNDLREPTQIGW